MGILEKLLAATEKQNELLETLVASISGGAVAKSDSSAEDSTENKAKPKSKAKKEETKSKAKYTKQEVSEAVVSVKDTLGTPAAKDLLKQFGVAKMAEITEDKFDAIYEAATAMLESSGEPEEEDEDI